MVVSNITWPQTMQALRASLAAILLVLLLCPPVHAGSLDDTLIRLFPKNIGQFSYANVEAARQFLWFAQFQQQALPPEVITFEQFLSFAGININSQIDTVAWAVGADAAGPHAQSDLAAGGTVGVLQGTFDSDSAQSALDSARVPSVEIDGYKLYSCGAGPHCGDVFFVFLDSNTAAFGQRAILKELLDVASGDAQGLLANQGMLALISQANGDATFLEVVDGAAARQTLQQIAPGLSKFPRSAEILAGIRSLEITVAADTDAEFHVQTTCASATDSLFLSQILQAALLLRKYEASQSHPLLSQALDGATVTSNNSTVDLAIQISTDQLLPILEESSFAARM